MAPDQSRPSDSSARPLAVLVSGPLHLFRTTGIYLLRELLRAYDVILVAEEGYEGDADAAKALRLEGLRAVHLLPPFYEAGRYHRGSLAVAKAIKEAHPRLLLQHNDCFPHNLYFVACVPPDCLRATFANGFTMDLKTDFGIIEISRVQTAAQRLHLPEWLVRILRYVRTRQQRRWQYTFLPLLLQGKTLHPPLDPMTGRQFYRDTSALTQIHFVYTEREAELESRYFTPGEIRVVSHPVQECGAEVHKLIGARDEHTQITLLPTWGLHANLQERVGEAEAVRQMAQIWTRTLVLLRERLENAPICMKLHPLAARDSAMQAMVTAMKATISDLVVADPLESAERLILKSRCVVGDVSSVLWWANMLGNRIVVSVDAWGLPLGDEFSHHHGVLHVRDPETLASVPLAPGWDTVRRTSLLDSLRLEDPAHCPGTTA